MAAPSSIDVFIFRNGVYLAGRTIFGTAQFRIPGSFSADNYTFRFQPQQPGSIRTRTALMMALKK